MKTASNVGCSINSIGHREYIVVEAIVSDEARHVIRQGVMHVAGDFRLREDAIPQANFVHGAEKGSSRIETSTDRALLLPKHEIAARTQQRSHRETVLRKSECSINVNCGSTGIRPAHRNVMPESVRDVHS